MGIGHCSTFKVVVLLSLVLATTAVEAQIGPNDASNFIAVATGLIPSPSDPRIPIVQSQLEAIQTSCEATSRGASVTDKLAKSHSLLKVSQPLLPLLSDLVSVARAQCANVDNATLFALYVLERNAGATHTSTIQKLAKNPRALLRKWN